MKHCENCNIDVAAVDRACPLCQSLLTGEYHGPEIYPKLGNVTQSHKSFLAWLRFALVAIMFVSVIVNFFYTKNGAWSVLVVAAVVCVWIWLLIALRSGRNIIKRLFDQVWAISLFSVFWDLFIGWRGWSLNYIVPGIFICAMVTITILSVLMKVSAPDFMVYAVALIFFGSIPAILLLTGLIRVPHVAVICLLVSVLLLSKLLIFDWTILRHEIQKRFHM